MAGPGLDFAASPEIDVGASTAKTSAAFAPRTNSALQLAGALSDLNPKLQGAAMAVATEEQMVQGAAAKKLAVQTGGKKLAAAVSAGEIEPTQNPYFIQDYNREAAAVSTQAAFDSLNTDAATWAEKNDPVAYRQKYSQAVQDIGKDYDGSPDSQEGFRATAVQNTQQAYSANVAYNVQRITQERQENLSALVAKQIIQTNAQFAGKANGSQVSAAIEPLRQQWLSTGGDDAAWNKVALQGILAASFNTHNKDILDASKTMSNHLGGPNGGTIYDTLGSAEQIETARYRLVADERDALRTKTMLRQQQIFEQGIQAQGALFSMFGPRLFTGQVSADEQTQAVSAMSGKFPAAAVATAFGDAAKITNSIRELNSNRSSLYEQSGAGATHIATLYSEATQRGWTPEMGNDLGQLLLQGNISQATSKEITDKALQTTGKLSVGALGTAGMSAATMAKHAANTVKQWQGARDAITTDISNRFSFAVRSGHNVTPATQQMGQDVAIQAASTWLELHPGDFHGAQLAATEGFKSWASRLPQ